MRLHEYQAKRLLARFGVPVPRGEVATSVDQAYRIAALLGERVVLKAQVRTRTETIPMNVISAAIPGTDPGAGELLIVAHAFERNGVHLNGALLDAYLVSARVIGKKGSDVMLLEPRRRRARKRRW